MDAFEPVRADAARLHAEIAATVAAPRGPMQLVDAAIKHLGLELNWLPIGDPALKNAKALYDDQTGAIFAVDEGASSEHALVVAHEIGHVRLHGGSASCTTHDVDPSRSTESAPVGLQRVEDYGARERRELQANVFAREFLLPRSAARQMFVAEGASASDIAKQRDLPLPLVRQQILDVILLPPVEADAPAATPATLDDPVQDEAAAHRDAPYLLEAGPGTGKTRTLVKRILSLLKEGVDPASILVLTFSNRAAGELSERIATVAPKQAPKIWIGTFHAFGLDLVRRHYELFKLPPDPELFDRSDAIAILEEILPTLPLKHYRNLWDPMLVLKDVLTAISRAKDELIDASGYYALARAMRDAAGEDPDAVEAAEKALEVAGIYSRYEAAKAEHASVDFGDLIMGPALLIENNATVRTALQLRHRHVLVDEYQDVNRASVRLVKGLVGDGKRLWAVGDARQSIYRFRGASSANMAGFKSEFPGATGGQLGISYRSTQQIVDTLVGFSPNMAASQGLRPLNLTANRGKGPALPDIRTFDQKDDEAEGVAAGIKELEAQGVKLRNQAVLCRTNKRLNEIAAALEARNIPVLHLGSLFEREEVRDLLALMSLAVEPFGDAIVRVTTFPRYAMPMQDLPAALEALRADKGAAISRLGDAATASDISAKGSAALTKLAEDLKGLSATTNPWDFLTTYLLDRTDAGRSMASAATTTAKLRNVAIWQFLNFLRDSSPIGHAAPVQRALDRVRQLVLLAEERDLRQVPAPALHMDAVRLMTVHGSKGLEFDAVHVPGLNTTSFPLNYRGPRCPAPIGMISGAEGMSVSEESKRSHAMEEECLFFVAMSRSKTYLRLYLVRFQDNGSKRGPSKLLEKLASGTVRATASPPVLRLPPGAPQPQAMEVRFPADWAASDRSIERYRKCPRRFFYTYVLGLGGARKSTAFSRTHDCLYDIIEWLAQARLDGEPDVAQAEAKFEDIWAERGPTDHAFAADYRALASRLVGALVRHGAGRRFRKAEPLAIDFPNGRIVVEPNEMATLADGTVVLRRVRTGYVREDEYDRLEYTLYLMAGAAHFGRKFAVEAVHLTDETLEAVSVTTTKFENRKEKTDEMLAGIAAGSYPPEVDAFTCPRCPHFFICPAAPTGALDLRK
jgi:DNA helicase-2/ATP-dependent DNA helicase PcrA